MVWNQAKVIYGRNNKNSDCFKGTECGNSEDVTLRRSYKGICNSEDVSLRFVYDTIYKFHLKFYAIILNSVKQYAC